MGKERGHFDKGLVIILLLFFLTGLVFILSTPLLFDLNSYTHQKISGDAIKHPNLFFLSYGKPLFTLLTAPFAKFGMVFFRLETLLFGLVTLIFVFQISKKLGLKYPHLAVAFTAFCTYFFYICTDGLTESLACMIIAISLHLWLRKRPVFAAIVLSSLFLVRIEGVLIIAFWAIIYLFQGRLFLIPAFGTFPLAFSLLTLFKFNNFFYFLTSSPNISSVEASGIYPPTNFLIFPLSIIVALGPMVFFCVQPAIAKIRKYYFLIIPPLLIILFQSTIASFGVFAMVPALRFLGMTFPFFGILAAIGLESLIVSRKKFWFFVFVLEAIFIPLLIFTNGIETRNTALYLSLVSIITIMALFLLVKIKYLPRRFCAISLVFLVMIATSPYLLHYYQHDKEYNMPLVYASEYIERNNFSKSNIYSFNTIPFYWLDLEMEGRVYNLGGLRYIPKGALIVYDSQSGPNEAQVPFEYISGQKDKFKMVYANTTLPMRVYIFEVVGDLSGIRS